MKRIPEPELMNDAAQAAAYAGADFEEPHNRVITLFRETFPDWHGSGHVLDLGCGPGDIAVRFARAYPACRIDGIDGAPAMLDADRSRIASDPDLCRRVHLHRVRLPDEAAPRERYDAVISNSLLHHLHDPQVFWHAVNRYADDGAPVFMVDLMRPETPEEAAELTGRYAAGEPDVLRHDFYHSLFAAFTVEEVEAQIRQTGLHTLQVKAISDRHLMAFGRMERKPS
jgi:cyclopropane fatty-acyl-phospholipid synthase-like methyltransferase